jgi:HEAT repeat protein
MEQCTLDELYVYLLDIDYRVRTLSAQAIQMKYATEEVFEKVSFMLNSNNVNEREIGAYILGQLGASKVPFVKESLPLLYKLFDDSDEEVVGAAIGSVGHLWSYTNSSDGENIDKVITFTKHKNSDIRILAVMTLVSAKYSDKVINTINKILNDEDEEVREWAEVAWEIMEENI